MKRQHSRWLWGRTFGVYLGLTEEFGQDRIIDTPISEQGNCRRTVGAALISMRPIADMHYVSGLPDPVHG